eukprot:498985-Rhodomonas_salina.1
MAGVVPGGGAAAAGGGEGDSEIAWTITRGVHELLVRWILCRGMQRWKGFTEESARLIQTETSVILRLKNILLVRTMARWRD